MTSHRVVTAWLPFDHSRMFITRAGIYTVPFNAKCTTKVLALTWFQTSDTSQQEGLEVHVCEMREHPLAPDDIIVIGLRGELLETHGVQLTNLLQMLTLNKRESFHGSTALYVPTI